MEQYRKNRDVRDDVPYAEGKIHKGRRHASSYSERQQHPGYQQVWDLSLGNRWREAL